jgi:hypothetical protein
MIRRARRAFLGAGGGGGGAGVVDGLIELSDSVALRDG